MKNSTVWTPDRAAIKISRISKVFSEHFGVPQFPVDVEKLALDAANQFGWKDPITDIVAAEFKGFEGGLFAAPDKKSWRMVYNKAITSPGRIRFTQAHELGHYILHRLSKEEFTCSYEDMIDWTSDGKDIEAEADSLIFPTFHGHPVMRKIPPTPEVSHEQEEVPKGQEYA